MASALLLRARIVISVLLCIFLSSGSVYSLQGFGHYDFVAVGGNDRSKQHWLPIALTTKYK
jgi:hypothetical protein